MSIAELFKRAPKTSTTVLVPFPKEQPEITFEIARLSSVEEKKLAVSALVQVREDANVDFAASFGGGYTVAMGEKLKTAIKGWTWTADADGEPFSSVAASKLIDELDFFTLQSLVHAYQDVIKTDNDAAKKNDTTAEASAPPSASA